MPGSGCGRRPALALPGQQDSLAKQAEVRASVHLALEHLDAVDVAFYRA